MPRKTASRLELRKQAEAAEKDPALVEAKAAKKKKKATKKRSTRRTKEDVIERKRLVWVIYTATLREEARFPYDQRTEAEERLAQLQAKGKRTYFLQPVKELLSGGPAPAPSDDSDDDDDDVPRNNEEMELDDNDTEDDGDGDVDMPDPAAEDMNDDD